MLLRDQTTSRYAFKHSCGCIKSSKLWEICQAFKSNHTMIYASYRIKTLVSCKRAFKHYDNNRNDNNNNNDDNNNCNDNSRSTSNNNKTFIKKIM